MFFKSQGWCLVGLLAALSCSVAIAQSDVKPTLVDGPSSPPLFGQIGEVQIADGQLLINQVEVRQVPVLEERIVVENGVEKKVVVNKFVFETSILQKRFSLVKGRVLTADEQPVSDKKLAETLKKGQVVVFSSDKSGHISKEFLKVLKPDTVVLLGKLE